MKVQQRLTSGTIIAQDFRTSVRFPIFETGYVEWPYATNGRDAVSRHVSRACVWSDLPPRIGGLWLATASRYRSEIREDVCPDPGPRLSERPEGRGG